MCGLCELALSQFVTLDRVHKIPILCFEASAESSEMIGIKMLLVICGKLSISRGRNYDIPACVTLGLTMSG